jgi:hypothetical protein
LMKLFFLHNCSFVADHRQRRLTGRCQKRPGNIHNYLKLLKGRLRQRP